MFGRGKTQENKRQRWGYTFEWSDGHLPLKEIEELRARYDELGSAALERLQTIVAQIKSTESTKTTSNSSTKPDLYIVLRDHYQNDEVLKKFWAELYAVPDWVDWQQLDRGQQVIGRYTLPICTGFALQGLLREGSASPGMAEVFSRTGGFSVENLLPRLVETFTWIVQITNSLQSIQPGGKGHTSTIRVRLLHASIRQRIMKLAASYPKYYDIQKHGAPVNDLDSIHAISNFCCIPAFDSLPKLGIFMTRQEIIDLIALFRYIAYLTGTPDKYWDKPEKARAIMETAVLYELNPTKSGKLVAQNFLKFLEDKPPVYLSRGFMEAGCRWMNGNEICDALDLGRPSPYYYALFIGFNSVVCALAYTQKLIPSFDRFMVEFWRNKFSNILAGFDDPTNNKVRFDFKWIPQIGKGIGEVEAANTEAQAKLPRPMERILLSIFIFGSSLIAIFVALALSRIIAFVLTYSN